MTQETKQKIKELTEKLGLTKDVYEKIRISTQIDILKRKRS